jgi:hypothetical protein
VWWLVQLLVGGSSVSVAVLPLGGLLCSLAALLLGALLLAVGLVAELVTAQHMRDRAAYSIHERTPSGPATAGAPAENQAG